jgi:23S rRNA (pseudouridine1915-N3)-methyltransferase
MFWRIVTVGKPALAWAREAVEDYLARLSRLAKIEVISLKKTSREAAEARMLELGKGMLCIALDERGAERRSMDLARWVREREMSATKGVCLFIGGADGHSEGFRSRMAEAWALSRLTLQHELALVVLLEQIYRAHEINRGGPYHRE